MAPTGDECYSNFKDRLAAELPETELVKVLVRQFLDGIGIDQSSTDATRELIVDAALATLTSDAHRVGSDLGAALQATTVVEERYREGLRQLARIAAAKNTLQDVPLTGFPAPRCSSPWPISPSTALRLRSIARANIFSSTVGVWERAAAGLGRTSQSGEKEGPRPFPHGTDPSTCEQEWTRDCVPPNTELPKAERVGLLLPNPEGIYDVGGNVAEWTADLFSMVAYESCPEPCKNPCFAALARRVGTPR
ncbi:MAG TPA: SUMF1/EgtB/PvdO family nonheme iron enzyme [Polyangiaceae bacterium]|nr:SUMF1/EgtB/PvdO family nonheme iron enzyme [Polyangiaceae bacterium]